MNTTSTDGQTDNAPLRVAFYLPQFHQTPENDAWHGPAFTEWTVVAQSRPLFPGHPQPDLPGELGFYDLRLPETRELQARLARSHGISGFCYYHYWFKGRRMLDRPFHEVLTSGKPDFPFSLCWANESWYRRWQGSADELLVEQEFDEDDDIEHIRWLIEAFKDPRYIRIKGRPLLTVYRPQDLPDPKRTVAIWRRECALAGIPDPWLVGFETRGVSIEPASIGFDAGAEFVPHGIGDIADPMPLPPQCAPTNIVYDYASVAAGYEGRSQPEWTRYPCVATAWDNTPRRRHGEAVVLLGSTPERYGQWLDTAMTSQSATEGADGIVFVNAWNEWAEGAHLEPDDRHGRAYLETTRDVVLAHGAVVPTPTSTPTSTGEDSDDTVPPPTPIEDLYADLYESFMQFQQRSSGYLAHADRRVQALGKQHAKELDEQRAINRSLAEWSLGLQEQIDFLTDRLGGQVPSGVGADPVTLLSTGESTRS